MGDAMWNNLGGILTGGALFLTALGTFVNIIYTLRNRDTLKDTKADVADLKKEVTDGAKEVQKMLGDITKTAVAAATAAPAIRPSRATDRKTEP